MAAFGAALWNLGLLPAEPYRSPDAGTGENRGVGWFLDRESAPLLGQAFCYGLIAAFYYTYAVDLVRQPGFSDAWGPVLWSMVGVSGIAGVFSGDAALRFGIRRCLVACLLVLGTSIGALSFSAGSGTLVVVCALAFGAGYMPIAAFLALWSGNVFHERPAAGFSAVLFSLAVGSIVGPALLGGLAGAKSLEVAFWSAAVLTALSAFLAPASDVRDTTPEESEPTA